MGHEEVTKIKAFFRGLNIHPRYLEHKAVITSDDAAKTRGFALRQGIKAILLTNGSGEWVIIDIPADQKVDIKKVAEELNWSKGKTRMATPEEVLQKTGCEVGAVPPFGHRELIPVLVDRQVYENHESAFNVGVRTQSVVIETTLMKKVFENVNAREGNFVRES
ncbi:hypothetical protein HY496_03595 [Candidatus Woesearchaeota archaeon]|nr:hypothetical protein [Candidatus Woesearchaeota archaeon]